MPTDPVPPTVVHTRSGEDAATGPFKKPVTLPAAGDKDPDEAELITQATRTSTVFAELGAGAPGGTAAALAAQPGTVARALTQHADRQARAPHTGRTASGGQGTEAGVGRGEQRRSTSQQVLQERGR